MNAPARSGAFDPQVAMAKPRPSIGDVQRLVAAAFDLPVEAMGRETRRRGHARPRQVAIYLADRLCGKTSGQLGLAFNRDHSTIMHAVARIAALRQHDAGLDEVIRMAERTLTAGARLGLLDLVDQIEEGLCGRTSAATARLREAMLRDPWATLAKLEQAFPAPDAEQPEAGQEPRP